MCNILASNHQRKFLACAVLYQMKVLGLHGKVHTFEKPWFTTWESAAALWVSMLGYWVLVLWHHWGTRKAGAVPEEREPLLSVETSAQVVDNRKSKYS